MSTVNTFFFSWLATVIYNLDSARFQKAKLDTRVEGWTESWGNDDEEDDEAKNSPTRDTIDNRSVSLLLSTPHPQLPIVLTQYRPAWFEQMLLRVSGLPHIVVNCRYIANEATGPLPYLSDCSSKPPILVGRYHPSNLEINSRSDKNKILAYLQENRNIDLDKQASLTSTQQRGLSRCFQFIIDSELSKILLYLRYEDSDPSWWEQVYRKQYIEASSTFPKNQRRLYSYELLGRFQASMERAVERWRLSGSSLKKKSRKQILQQANDAYSAIDSQLKENETKNLNKSNYLLATDRPALVDVKLWSHLAEALCDVHLVVLLASYPRLVTYFHDMYRTYFTLTSDGAECDWKHWNEQQNLSNAFQRIPTLGKQNLPQFTNFKNATDLVQKLSLRKDDLVEVLKAVKAKRNEELVPRKRRQSILYRWCMGDETLKKKNRSSKETMHNPIRQKLIREQIRNDQTWISAIVGVSAVAILLMQGGNDRTS